MKEQDGFSLLPLVDHPFHLPHSQGFTAIASAHPNHAPNASDQKWQLCSTPYPQAGA